MQRPAFLLSIFVAAWLSGCSGETIAPPPIRTVMVHLVAPNPGKAQMVLNGEVRARHEADLAFRVGGKIVARLADVGAAVKPGTVLARLDPADLQLAQQAARAQLAAAESDAATTRAERERYADLLNKKFVSQAAFDLRDNAAKAARARFDQAQAQALVSGNQLAYGNLVADQAGVITAVLADVGQVVGAGQAVMRLARPEEKEVVVAVPESRVAELKSASTIEVGLWALPELQMKGELRELSPAADATTRTYAARIRIINPPPSVSLGMTARIVIGHDLSAAPLVVPLGAVVDQGQGPAVWVVADGKVRRQPVVVRQFREDGVELTSGLKGGETIVVSGASRLAADQPVKPLPVTEPAR